MNERKKIVYLITKSQWGGASKYVYDLAKTTRVTADVLVIAGGEGALVTRLRMLGVKTYSINSLARDISLLKEVRSFWKIYTVLKKERPDILHLNSSKAGGLGALAGRLARTPHIIFTAHGFAFHERRPALSQHVRKLLSYLTVLLCHVTIAVSQVDAESFSSWPFTTRKVVYIPNGIDPFDIPPRAEARRELKDTYGIPGDHFLIGSIGELTQNKGYPLLLEAVAQLPTTTSLCIIGEGEDQNRLSKQVREENIDSRVYFIKSATDASHYLKAFDVFVLPSLKEGLPYVLLEAGIQQIPIVTTRVGGIPDLITHNEEGLLVEAGDVSSLVAAIKAVKKESGAAEVRAKKLYRKITAHFNWTTTILPRTLNHYHLSNRS